MYRSFAIRAARRTTTALTLVLALAAPVGATNGYFTHGYGTPTKALAGAGVALPQDTLATATNPAGMAFVGKRYDAGLGLFHPSRSYTVVGQPSGFPGTFGLLPGKVKSDSEYFLVPHFGANWKLGESSTFGFALYGHGGMNTDYPTDTFYASRPTGVDLSQLFVAPTYAFRFAGGRHAIGIAPVLAYQQFEIKGVGSFAPFSADPANLSNRGSDGSFGYGAKIGYLGRWTDRFSFGLAYQSQMRMDEFGKYKGLFAEQGGFDVPSSLTGGIAVQPNDRLTFVFDVQQIYYSDIKSVSNPFLPNLVLARLGDDAGAGFGWRDMTAYKLGVQWRSGDSWTWRLGASTGDQPIRDSEVLFNILAPGVMEEHFTFGFTRRLEPGRALNFSLLWAPSVSVRGPNPLEVPGLQTIELEMDQLDIEASYSWGF